MGAGRLDYLGADVFLAFSRLQTVCGQRVQTVCVGRPLGQCLGRAQCTLSTAEWGCRSPAEKTPSPNAKGAQLELLSGGLSAQPAPPRGGLSVRLAIIINRDRLMS